MYIYIEFIKVPACFRMCQLSPYDRGFGLAKGRPVKNLLKIIT